MRNPAVDNYLCDKPDAIRQTLEVVREIIFANVKGVEEQLKWRCPFYTKDGMLCYLNYDRKLKRVILAFVEGFLLEDKYGVLKGDTINIKKLVIDSVDSINENQISYYLKQALKINKTKTKNFMAIQKRRV